MAPGVGPVVLAEVVVRRVLAAEGGAGLGHHLLDEAVADPGADRRAAALAHDLGHRLRADAVVEDRGPGLLGQHAGGDDRGGGRAGEPDALARRRGTPGRRRRRRPADVGAGLEHPGLEVDLVRRVDRVGGVVREGAVELAVHDLEVERQPVEHGGHDEPAHAVGGVGDDLQRRAAREVSTNERTCVGVVAEQVGSALLALETRRDRLEAGRGHRLDVVEAGVLARPAWRRDRQTLMPLYCGGVVAGGEHRRRRVEVAGGEVDEVGRGQAEVDDVEALVEHALGERGRRARRPAGAHVAGDEHPGGAVALGGEAGEGGADAPAVGGIELVGCQTPDVVGLEDRVEVTHGAARLAVQVCALAWPMTW